MTRHTHNLLRTGFGRTAAIAASALHRLSLPKPDEDPDELPFDIAARTAGVPGDVLARRAAYQAAAADLPPLSHPGWDRMVGDVLAAPDVRMRGFPPPPFEGSRCECGELRGPDGCSPCNDANWQALRFASWPAAPVSPPLMRWMAEDGDPDDVDEEVPY